MCLLTIAHAVTKSLAIQIGMENQTKNGWNTAIIADNVLIGFMMLRFHNLKK